jgi:hypothetical protein
MMEPEKFKKLVTAMMLTVMSGNIDVRIRYLGDLIDHLSYYVRTEKLEKGRPEILNTRQKLMDTFNFILHQNIAKFKLNPQQLRKIQEDFKNHYIILDYTWHTPQAEYGTQVLREMEGLSLAKQHYYRAVAAHSEYLSGSTVGLTNATGEAANAMRIIMQVCYDNDLLEITENEWRKSVSSSTPAPEPASKR